jgi:hypothetical protein
VGLSLENQGALITVEWSLRPPPDQAPLYSNTCGSSRDQHHFCTFINIKKKLFYFGLPLMNKKLLRVKRESQNASTYILRVHLHDQLKFLLGKPRKFKKITSKGNNKFSTGKK